MVYCSSCYRQMETTGECPYCQTGSVQDPVKKVIPVSNVPAYDIMIPVETVFVMTQDTKVH